MCAENIEAFISAYGCLDDMLNIENTFFDGRVNKICPSELRLSGANSSDTAFLDLHLTIPEDFISSRTGDGCVNFSFLNGDILHATLCGVCVAQLIRFARMSSHVADFNTRNNILKAKLLKQRYRYHDSVKLFQNSIDTTTTWYQDLILDSCLVLSKAFRNLFFIVTLCINSENLLVGMFFLVG